MKDLRDPKGLIREAYRIDGIDEPECRTIFLDWALSLPPHLNPQETVKALLETYETAAQEHPMTYTLKAALVDGEKPKRRGGRRSRVPD